jgi:hypothetical protein
MMAIGQELLKNFSGLDNDGQKLLRRPQVSGRSQNDGQELLEQSPALT